jgi:colanic acid/amylovoran biosynthesis glycosyltransferase
MPLPANLNEKLAVVHRVSRWLPQTATWLYTQVSFLPPHVESHVVCEATLNLDQFPHPRVHSLAAEPRWRVVWDKGMRKVGARRHLRFTVDVARRAAAAVLHSHFGDTGWGDIGAARAAGIRHVVTFYGLDVIYYPTADPRWRTRYAQLFASVDRVLCEGPHMARCIVALGCPAEKVRVQHLGVDLRMIPFAPRGWTPAQPLRVLLCGSFREKKGFPYALDALARIKDEVPLEITVIGDEHGDERTRVEKRRILDAVARGGLGRCTRFLGYQPYETVMAEASRHHVFLSPSVTAADGDTEGGAPVTLIEMSASGMMIVSTTHCDIPGVVIDGVTGLLAPERDTDALVAHLRWVVAHPERWRAMQAAGREHMEAEFDARVQGERLAAIYREIAGS